VTKIFRIAGAEMQRGVYQQGENHHESRPRSGADDRAQGGNSTVVRVLNGRYDHVKQE
jgi:hypothetical protein